MKNKMFIRLLIVINIILLILCILFATDTINFKINDKKSDENDTLIENTTSNNKQQNENKTDITIENYLGNRYLNGKDGYSYINIEKTSTNYVIDIRVNKMADYNDLEIQCRENSSICYFSGDENHNFTLIMAHDKIEIIPDYATKGTSWTFEIIE